MNLARPMFRKQSGFGLRAILIVCYENVGFRPNLRARWNFVIFRDKKKIIFREKNVYHHDDYNIRLFLDEILRIKNFYYVPPTLEFAVFFFGFFFFFLFFFSSVVDIPSHTVVKIKLKKLRFRRNLTMIQYSRLSIILWPTNMFAFFLIVPM